MPGRCGRRGGFTLIEGIAATVILATAVPPMLWAVRQASSARANSVLASRARWLAAEKLEDIIADRHSSTRGYTYLATANYPAESAVAGYPGYARSVAITESAADLVSAGTGYKRVSVSATYLDDARVSRTATLSTVLASYSP
jgi:hypothetical protein